MSSWRDMAAPIIKDVIESVGTSDMKALRTALRDRYPFGERKYLPYKVWLDEIQRQIGSMGPREDRRTIDLFANDR